HMRERRVGEHAVGHEAGARAAGFPRGGLTDNAKVVAGDVRELRAACAVPHRPDAGRGGLQPPLDAANSASVQFDAAFLKSDPARVRNAPRGNQNVAALELLLAGWRA